MKKTRKAKAAATELRAEYEFDYGKSRKNRFVAGDAPTVAVVLEPDVARVFGSSAKVNRLLRSVIRRYLARQRSSENAERADVRMRRPSLIGARLVRQR